MEYMSSLQNDFDDHKPSLFELLSEQQLSALIPPSLRYLLATATHRHPRYLLPALNSFEELYALLSLVVERYYLRTFGGSFTENFYSLKRERVLLVKNGEIPRSQVGAPSAVSETLKLRTSDVWRNLAVTVGIPYLKCKLDESYDIHAAPQASLVVGGGPRYSPSDELPHNPTVRQRLLHFYKWFLRNVYPSINAAYYFSILAFNLAYLFDNTKYSSPFLWMIGSRIRRLSPSDFRAIAEITQGKPKTPARTRPGSNLLGLLNPQTLYPQLLSSLRFLLPTSIFALKFLEWWHASDFSRQLTRKATETLDLPAPLISGMPPPQTSTAKSEKTSPTKPSTSPEKSTTQSRLSKPPISSTTLLPIFTVPIPPSDSGNICPICLNQLTNPTACQTGYVFCYVCIFRWVSGEHERQMDFMSGEGNGANWGDRQDEDGGTTDDGDEAANAEKESASREKMDVGRSREGRWESGKGRCAITGRRVLGETEGLRRVLI